ncbi:Serrate RNA effector molecule [Galdieria sulphuraria]|nr:Serrate RNA effector molecule [Galdieria sulphuraria]
MSQGSTLTGEQQVENNPNLGDSMDGGNSKVASAEPLPPPPRRGSSGFPRRGSSRFRSRGQRGPFTSSHFRMAQQLVTTGKHGQYIQSLGRRQHRDWDESFEGGSRVAGSREQYPFHDPFYKKRRKSSRDSHWSSDEETEPLSFKEFLSREDNSITPEQAQEAYKKYKKEFYKRKPKYFFEKHMNEEWFCEKYHPSKVLERVNRIRQSCKEQVERFKEMLGKESIDTLAPSLEAKQEVVETTNVDGNDNGKVQHKDEEEMKEEEEEDNDDDDDTFKEQQIIHSNNMNMESEGISTTDSEPSCCVFLRGIPCWMSRQLLENTLKYVKKEDKWEPIQLLRLKLSEVKPEKNLERFGWAYYESVDEASRVMEYWNGQKLWKPNQEQEDKSEDNCYVLDMRFNHEPRKKYDKRRNTPVILPELFQSARRLEHDAKQIVFVMRHLDYLRDISQLNPLTDEMLNGLSTERRIDVCSFYLRFVHGYCYYSGVECVDPDDDPLPPAPLRPPKKDNNMSEYQKGGDVLESNRKTGAEWRVDEPVNAILQRNYDHPKGTVSIDSESLREERIAEWLEENTKYEGQGRYRCSLPPFKLFQGKEYVHKHLRTKHTEEMQKVIEKADKEQFIENYLNDPNHLDDSKVFDIRMGRNMSSGYMPVLLPSGMVAPMQFVPGSFHTVRGSHLYRGMKRRGRRRVGGLRNSGMGHSDPRAAQGPRHYADLDAPPQDDERLELPIPN